MKLSHLFLAAIITTTALADEQRYQAWAPGVSEKGGWVDTNKAKSEDSVWGDTGMCWAAAASNVITWWNKWNASSLPSSTAHKDPWTVFRAVYKNDGLNPQYALDWWINGKYDTYYSLTTPSLYDETGFTTYNESINSAHKGDGTDPKEWSVSDWPYGAFLNGNIHDSQANIVYNTNEHAINITSSSVGAAKYSQAIIDALNEGYALTFCTSKGAWHAFTLWGVEYKYDEAAGANYLTSVFVTDSDDIKNGEENGGSHLAEYSVSIENDKLRIDYGGDYDYFYMESVDGMWTDPKLVPEPASATLGLAALMMLCARRRRKA